MSVVIPYTFVAGNKAKASEVNANFAAVAAKFTEGAGGIKDEDISSGAGIRRTKLSTVAGSRITEAQMEDDAVDSRVLKDDATAGSPNAAVGTSDHIKDGIITNAKIFAGTIKKGSLNLASVLIGTAGVGAHAVVSNATGLNSATAFPIFWHVEGAPAPADAGWANIKLVLDTTTGDFSLKVHDASNGGAGVASLGVRIWYLVI